MLNLDTNITNITSVGTTAAKRLKLLGIENVKDLIFYFPFRYEDYSEVTPISNLQANTNTNIVGQIELIQNKRSPRKKLSITEALISDESDQIRVIWFNQPFIAKNLHVGDTVSLSGKIDSDYSGLIMKSPAYEKIFSTQSVHTQGLVPIYHLTANLTQKQIRFLINKIINVSQEVKDWLPEDIIKRLDLPNYSQALQSIHFPKNLDEIKQAQKRLGFNEIFLTQLQSQIIRQANQKFSATPVPFLEKEIKEFVDSLPFKLTDAQRKAAWEIIQDLKKNQPMSRLLEGDVGSGKTVVALLAMLNIALNKELKGQCVLMVPTEILARQHYQSITKMLTNYDIEIGLVTRSNNSISNPLQKTASTDEQKKSKTKAQEICKQAQIIIGTHALIQADVEFDNLVLAIIDEQHRFGVEQRKKLLTSSIPPSSDKQSFQMPHLLSMTATPIPRSLALALYGDLDLSIINQMPIGRKKIATQVVPEIKRDKAYEFIREQIKNGRQVFVICPLIDISDKLGVKSVKEEFKKLDEEIFPDLKIGILHGRLKTNEKDQTMQDFLDNKIKVLVSTSVIEVGVDVPNATIMMIEGSDRFGLAQLHQFRGRVGRGNHQSYCFLFTDSDAPRTIERLNSMTRYSDGFSLAKEDLKYRGPGEVYGTNQKGFPEFQMADLFDYEIMKQAKDEAVNLIENDPDFSKHPELKGMVDRWGREVHLE